MGKLIISYIGVAIAIIGLLYMRQIWSLCLHLLKALKERDKIEEAYKANSIKESIDLENFKRK